MSRTPTKEESKHKKLQRKYEEAKKEIKRLRNIIKRTNPNKLKELIEGSDQSYKYNRPDKPDKPSCPKCHGYKIKVMEFTRSDGTFQIKFCTAAHCGHRTRPEKVEKTESNQTQE